MCGVMLVARLCQLKLSTNTFWRLRTESLIDVKNSLQTVEKLSGIGHFPLCVHA